METVLRLDDKEYKAVYKGITPRLYREYFGQDLMLDISKIQNKFNERVIKDRDENIKEDAYFILLEEGGSLFFERLVWVCIKAAKTLDKEDFLDFKTFIDGIEDYDVLVGVGFYLLELISFGTKPTVDAEGDEQVEDTTKKKD